MKFSPLSVRAEWARFTAPWDTRLDRIIAIKVLPVHVADRPRIAGTMRALDNHRYPRPLCLS
jgi:hypothetical protein